MLEERERESIFLYNSVTQLYNDNRYIFLSSIATFTGATSSIYGVYRDPKESIIERFLQDTPKYVALKDLFQSQDKSVTSTANCEQPYESFYDFGFTTDYR